MAFSDYIYLFVAISYFTLSLLYLPPLVFSFIGSKTEDETNIIKYYYTIRNIFVFMIYLIIGGLYLIMWNSHGEHGSHGEN